MNDIKGLWHDDDVMDGAGVLEAFLIYHVLLPVAGLRV